MTEGYERSLTQMPVIVRALAALVCVGLSLGLLAVLTSRAEAESALLDPLALRVTVSRGNTHTEVAQQRIVYDADDIRTDATGQALVTYRDGSTVLLDTDSELVIEYIRADDGDLIVRMRQTLGRAWYTIAQSLSWRGRYEVSTPAMASVIRAGSGSLVIVGPDGETTVVAIDGTVEATAAGMSITVPAGTKTTAIPGHPPSAPAPAPSPSPAPSFTPSPSPTPSPSLSAAPAAPAAPAPPSAGSPSPLPASTSVSTSRPVVVTPTPLASLTPVPSATATLAVPIPTVTFLPTPPVTPRPTSSPIATATAAPLPTVAPTVAPLPTISIAPPVPLP